MVDRVQAPAWGRNAGNTGSTAGRTGSCHRRQRPEPHADAANGGMGGTCSCCVATAGIVVWVRRRSAGIRHCRPRVDTAIDCTIAIGDVITNSTNSTNNSKVGCRHGASSYSKLRSQHRSRG